MNTCENCRVNLHRGKITKANKVPAVLCVAPPGNAVSTWQMESLNITNTTFQHVQGELWVKDRDCPAWVR